MAFTVATIHKSVFGDKRLHVLSCTADGASDAFDTGLGSIDFYTFAPISMSTGADGGPKLAKNALTAATASPGYMSVTGITSGDVFYLHVYGR